MTASASYTVAARTALSYLDDVKAATDALCREDNHLLRAQVGQKIIQGDLRLARRELMGVSEEERPILEAKCEFCEGMIKYDIAQGYAKFYAVPDIKKQAQTALVEACEAFTRAINLNPRPNYYYTAGVVYSALGRNAEAVQMFEQAANGDDPDTAIEARKEIGRIGPVAPPSVAAVKSDGGVSFTRQKKMDYGAGVKGIVAVVVGAALLPHSAYIIGIPILLWGIWQIYAGFVKGIDA